MAAAPAQSGTIRAGGRLERGRGGRCGAAFCELDAAAGGHGGDRVADLTEELVEEMKEARRLIGLLDNPENMVTAAFVINQIRTWMRGTGRKPADGYLARPGDAGSGGATPTRAPGTTTRETSNFCGTKIWLEGHHLAERGRRVSSVGLFVDIFMTAGKRRIRPSRGRGSPGRSSNISNVSFDIYQSIALNPPFNPCLSGRDGALHLCCSAMAAPPTGTGHRHHRNISLN